MTLNGTELDWATELGVVGQSVPPAGRGPLSPASSGCVAFALAS